MILRKEVTREIQAHILVERSVCLFYDFTIIVGAPRSIGVRPDEKHHGNRQGHGIGVEESSRDPHVDIKDDKVAARSWAIEMYNPLTMRRAGWNQDILKAGDEITITFHPAKNGNTLGYVREDDGKIIFKGQELKLSSNGQ